jgi:Predicted phosphoesterase or phosphohydrolase
MAAFFTSDLHFMHDKEFLYGPRGFSSIGEMNEAVVDRWNSVVKPGDTVYVLGDLMLGGNSGTEAGAQLLSRLAGDIRIILGNHDTDNRIAAYSSVPSVKSILYADRLKVGGLRMFLTHYPCLTGNEEKSVKQTVFSLSGHTHSKELFHEGNPLMYNVALDAHNCTPVHEDEVVADIVARFGKI